MEIAWRSRDEKSRNIMEGPEKLNWKCYIEDAKAGCIQSKEGPSPSEFGPSDLHQFNSSSIMGGIFSE